MIIKNSKGRKVFRKYTIFPKVKNKKQYTFGWKI